MSKIGIGETQFLLTFFSKFNEYNLYAFDKVIAPSTVLEGNQSYEYSGADLVLDDYYFQLKLPDYLFDPRANEYADMGGPYFRFTIKNEPNYPTRYGQFDFLKERALESTKNEVYYVAPFFEKKFSHRSHSPNFWYRSFYKSKPSEINNFCSFFDINDIDENWISQDNKHKICYTSSNVNYNIYSDPKMQKRKTPLVSNKQIKTNDLANAVTIEEKINNLNERLIRNTKIINRRPPKIIDNYKINPLYDLQLKIFELTNVFWRPIIFPAKCKDEINL